MDLTFEAVKLKVIRLLGDQPDPATGSDSDYAIPLAGMSFSADLLKDGLDAALDALAQRYWKSATKDLEGGSASFKLPDDLIDIEGVRDLKTGLFVPRAHLEAGKSVMPKGSNAWMEFPTGTLFFVNALETEGGTLFYSAIWAKASDDTETLEPPNIALTAISLYAASYCLLNSASQAANLGQYDTKTDAGKPTDNPMVDMSNAFLKRYDIEVARLPQKEKGHTN